MPQQVLAEAPCLFVLSTGRCGTLLLSRLLATNFRLDVYHHRKPALLYASKLIYSAGPAHQTESETAILHARYEFVRDSYATGGIYVETNNRITFYAQALANVFAGSRFVHLVRHPGSFVRSAIRRRYYEGVSADEGRIVPRKTDPASETWPTMSRVRRAAWLWNATQQEIENFKSSEQRPEVLTVRAEDLFTKPQETLRVFEYIGVDAPEPAKITKMLHKPINAQSESDTQVDPWTQWPDDWLNELAEETPLANRYGYGFDRSD